MGSIWAGTLSYSVVKLFSKHSNCVKNLPERHGRTDGQTTYCGITALCVASRGKNAHLQLASRPIAAHSLRQCGYNVLSTWLIIAAYFLHARVDSSGGVCNSAFSFSSSEYKCLPIRNGRSPMQAVSRRAFRRSNESGIITNSDTNPRLTNKLRRG